MSKKKIKITFTNWEIKALYEHGMLRPNSMEYFDFMPHYQYKKMKTGFDTAIEKLKMALDETITT